MKTARIALVGDYDASVTAHRAIPMALELAGVSLGVTVASEWLPTDSLAIAETRMLEEMDAIWCVPASPYRSERGALTAIRFAREARLPFLGTCGGFQHAVLEYARHVAGFASAAHAESEPEAVDPLIAPLACALVEASGDIVLEPGTRIARAYGATTATEAYNCRYGLAPRFAGIMNHGPLRVSARDPAGEVRGVELDEHPFFVATLFQPERSALTGRAHPLVTAFVREASS